MLNFDELLGEAGKAALKGADVGFCALGTTRGKSGVVSKSVCVCAFKCSCVSVSGECDLMVGRPRKIIESPLIVLSYPSPHRNHQYTHTQTHSKASSRWTTTTCSTPRPPPR